MSTRANVIIKDANTTLYFYRHSDGYPDHCGKDLVEFVKDYGKNGIMRSNATQSAGWLIIRGHQEYLKSGFTNHPGYAWKVGAYEPTSDIHGDVEYIYTIDLQWDCPLFEGIVPESGTLQFLFYGRVLE